MKNFCANRALRAFFTSIVILGIFAMNGCDTTGDEGSKPDPQEEVDPKTPIAIEEIVFEKFGSAVVLGVFPETNKNLQFMTGNGEYSARFTFDLTKLDTPDISSQNGKFLAFKDNKVDTLFLFKNGEAFLTFVTKEGLTQGGAPRGISYADKRSVERISQESLFAY